MAVTYDYLEKYSAVIVKATGVVTTEDLFNYANNLLNDERISKEHVTLFDATDVVDIKVSPDDIEKLFELEQSNPQKGFARKLAIVTRGEKETEIAKIYEKLASRMMENTILFFHLDLAYKWLGIPYEYIKDPKKD